MLSPLMDRKIDKEEVTSAESQTTMRCQQKHPILRGTSWSLTVSCNLTGK